MQVQPYLFFEGRAEEAFALYQKVLGAQVEMLMRYADCPDKSGPLPADQSKVMHASLRIGDAMVMASDGHVSGKTNFQGFSLAITAKDETEAKRIFEGLGAGGEVRMPLTKTFFSPAFGMLADKFGVGWMIMVQPA
jgi:PhnB protein